MNDHLSRQDFGHDFITVVSGLPRSGTSMMMQILHAGNMPLLINNFRKADDDNPKGYFEFEAVKDLEQNNSWLHLAKGKAIKIVSPLLYYLNFDEGYRYKIIFMQRSIDEILASQNKMSARRHKDKKDADNSFLRQNYFIHILEIQEWLDSRENSDVLYVNYRNAIEDPLATAEDISYFLNINLNINEMIKVSDNSLYRNHAEKFAESEMCAGGQEDTDRQAIKDQLKQLGYL